MLEPIEGQIVVKIIKECEIVTFENEIYQMDDNMGKKFVMHATKTTYKIEMLCYPYDLNRIRF